MEPKSFQWDWKEQPPMEEIAAAVAEISGVGRRAWMRPFNTESDQYAWIVSDRELSDAEAYHAYWANCMGYDPATDPDAPQLPVVEARDARIAVTIEPPARNSSYTEILDVPGTEFAGLSPRERDRYLTRVAEDYVNQECSWGWGEVDPE